jgi:ribosome-binding factor A
MGTDAEKREIFTGLAKARGYVRSELGRRLTLRYLPEVVFKKDVSGPRGDRVLQLLDELQSKDEGPMGSSTEHTGSA